MFHEHFLFSPNIFWISISLTLCLFVSLLSCVCGCRKRVPKNELLGLDGLVKITNPDENVNFSSVATSNAQWNSSNSGHHQLAEELAGESNNCSKRGNNAVATATRSLPDLPVDSGEAAEKLWGPAEINVDTNSDLYATVEDAGRKKRPLVSGLTVESNYTPSQTDDSLSPYARLKGEHPYDQLKQNEHPYAQVGLNGAPGPSTSHDTVSDLPLASPRAGHDADSEGSPKRSSPGGSSPDHIPEEIPAASAIAGSVPANQDLPYMTPPIVASQQQLHFSGDSADSSKGYTSISVREPLSRILADRRRRSGGVDDSTNGNRNGCDSGSGIASSDPHYATVSDDSDEMYAAIEERHMSLSMEANNRGLDGVNCGGGEYTSGSETYAQIAPLPSAGAVSVSSATDSPPPPSRHPPNLSLVLHHQDSVSTCSSSDSPRRERRAANSPLPQVPLPTLDDMYAKVIKKGRTPTSPEPTDNGPPVLRAQDVDDDPSSLPGYETVSTSSSIVNHTSSAPSLSSTTRSGSVASSSRSNSIASQTGGGVVMTSTTTLSRHSSSAMDPNYEELTCGTEPDYASLSRPSAGGHGYPYSTAVVALRRDSRQRLENEDPGVYEDSPFGSLADPNYERVGSDLGEREPPYERLNNPSPELPDYEVVCNRSEQRVGSLSDLYAKVNKPEK